MSGPARPAASDGAAVSSRLPAVVRVLVGLLVFVGAGSISGAAAFLIDTTGGAAGLDPQLLARTPFTTFLWPGILLTVLLGIPAFVLAYGVMRQPTSHRLELLERVTGRHWSWVGTIGLGAGLMAWIVVQVLLIDSSFLQPLMFGVGAAIVAVGCTPTTRQALERQGLQR